MMRALSCLLLLATGTVVHAQSGSKPPAPRTVTTKPAAPKVDTPKKEASPKAPEPEAAPKTGKPKAAPPPAAAATAPAPPEPFQVERRLDTLLLMPEPKVMRSAMSMVPTGAKQTVLTPYRESAASPGGIEPYTQESFAKLGLGVETFAQRAKAAADKRLMQLQPELIKGEDGKVIYAVYRGESPLFPTLLIAPSLPQIFAELFGKEIWVAMPDRHALYIFPAKPELLHEFTADLAERYTTDPYAASCEVFSLKVGEEPKVIASFGE